MPVHDNVDVRVIVGGLPLLEYPDPDGEETGGDQIVRYIEATVDQRFEVFIRWLPGFQLKKASNLVHSLCLDGRIWLPQLPTECKGLPSTNNILNTEQSFSYRNANVNLGQGRIKTAFYTFGALDISESTEMQASFKIEQLKDLGEIKLTTYRGGKVTVGNEYTVPVLDVCDQVPEKLMKGRLLKNNVRYDASDVDGNRKMRSWTCNPLGGKAGRKSVFVFKYRSKKILQRLGCMPRSPSPEPDYALISERQEELIRLGKDKERQANLEVLRLRQRIEQLEGSVGSASEPRGVKRKREEDVEELEELEPPPKRATVMVDLTEDD